MVSAQRRRGQPITLWASTLVTDARGNPVLTADPTRKIATRAAVIPQRSSRAEVPGQQDVNVVRIMVKADLSGIDLWGRVEWRGSQWDIVTPPAYHHGDRNTRHWTIDIRERPEVNGG